MRAELAALNAELEDLLRLIDTKNRELYALYEKGTTPVEISTRKRFISTKQQELAAKRRSIAQKEAEVEKQLGVVIAATQEVSKLEKLEEHQLEDYFAEEQKENEHLIDEFISGDDWRKSNM